jgi:hypothetical protein
MCIWLYIQLLAAGLPRISSNCWKVRINWSTVALCETPRWLGWGFHFLWVYLNIEKYSLSNQASKIPNNDPFHTCIHRVKLLKSTRSNVTRLKKNHVLPCMVCICVTRRFNCAQMCYVLLQYVALSYPPSSSFYGSFPYWDTRPSTWFCITGVWYWEKTIKKDLNVYSTMSSHIQPL